MSEKIEWQHVIVRASSGIDMATQLLEMGRKGAKVKNGTYVYLKGFPLVCELLVPVTKETLVKETPNLSPLPVKFPYTEDELKELSYDVLIQVAKDNDITAKKKADIIKEYLAKHEKVE